MMTAAQKPSTTAGLVEPDAMPANPARKATPLAREYHAQPDRLAYAALVYVAVCPAIVAYRCWGAGVQRVGPSVAGFFSNLTPLFAAVLSAAFLGEPPHLFHAIAFVLIVGGIVVSSRR